MFVAIYARPDGAYVLVPDHMPPSVDAQNGTGPLTLCETINVNDHPHPAVWERVNAEIDRHSFAVLQATVVERFRPLIAVKLAQGPSNHQGGLPGHPLVALQGTLQILQPNLAGIREAGLSLGCRQADEDQRVNVTAVRNFGTCFDALQEIQRE